MTDVLNHADNSALSGNDLARRTKLLRRAYARGMGCKPTMLQAAALNHAAKLQAIAEAALDDPTISYRDRAYLSGAARRALRDMREALGLV